MNEIITNAFRRIPADHFSSYTFRLRKNIRARSLLYRLTIKTVIVAGAFESFIQKNVRKCFLFLSNTRTYPKCPRSYYYAR